MTKSTICTAVGQRQKAEQGVLRMMIGATLAAALSLPLVCSAGQQEVPAEMMGLWSSFRDAVEKHDIDRVAMLSKFPIAANDFGGQIKSAVVLKKRYERIFTPLVEACFAREHPKAVPGYPGYLVDCNGYLGFGFRKYGGEYRFSYIDNANAE